MAQTVVEQKFDLTTYGVGVYGLAEGNLALERKTIGCSNPECARATIHIRVGEGVADKGYQVSKTNILFEQRVLPQGSGRPQPDYIPKPLREDYYEACLIRDLSPKASATLLRRCLQGMIRDFCKISERRLIDEIRILTKTVENGTADRSVTIETISAIDHVRKLGNIGAHMEKDINVIVDVDPGEAQAMIELIELLFSEWYGARHERAKKLANIERIGISKTRTNGPDSAASEVLTGVQLN